jgi:hypothetical protein
VQFYYTRIEKSFLSVPIRIFARNLCDERRKSLKGGCGIIDTHSCRPPSDRPTPRIRDWNLRGGVRATCALNQELRSARKKPRTRAQRTGHIDRIIQALVVEAVEIRQESSAMADSAAEWRILTEEQGETDDQSY